MKKSIFTIALAFGVASAFAQDLTSKKGEPILPEADDWAISFDASAAFRYFGNAFNGNTNNAAPSVNWLNSDQTIIGKKFEDEKNAFRVLLRLGYTNQTFKNLVADNSQTTPPTFPTQPAQVQDKFKIKNTNIGIGVGKEWRRGKTRLQGYYGADAMIWISMLNYKYVYGNTMSATTGSGTTTSPTSTQWNQTTGAVQSTNGVTSRPLYDRSGMTIGFGVRGFIGMEYFILPKISVGAEYGWGLGLQTTLKGKTLTEEQGGNPNQVAEVERETAGESKFGFDTDLNHGTIFGFNGSNSGSAVLRATFHF